MAQVVLSTTELIDILSANALIPDQITEVETNGEEIKAKVRTEWPVLKSVRVGIRFAGFDDGHVILQLVTNRLLDRFDWIADKMLESFRLEGLGGRWEYPRLHLDVNRLIAQRVRGVQITDVAFRDGSFHITTTHTTHPDEGTDPAGGEGVDPMPPPSD